MKHDDECYLFSNKIKNIKDDVHRASVVYLIARKFIKQIDSSY